MTLFPAGEPDVIELVLPWPPSANHFLQLTVPKGWRRPLVSITEEAKDFMRQLVRLVRASGVKPLKGRLLFEAVLYPPDRRLRDVDNPMKRLLDGLARRQLKSGKWFEGCYANDSQIRKSIVEFNDDVEPVKPGRVEVKISTMGL